MPAEICAALNQSAKQTQGGSKGKERNEIIQSSDNGVWPGADERIARIKFQGGRVESENRGHI
jgi:hypothetical protein